MMDREMGNFQNHALPVVTKLLSNILCWTYMLA